MAPNDLVVTSPTQFRSENTKVVRIDNGLVVRIQRHDLPGLVLQGVLPLTLFQASLRFRELQQKREEDAFADRGVEAQLKFLDQMRETGFLEFLQKYACITVVEPALTMERDNDPNHLCVTELNLGQLMAIHENGMNYDGLPHVPSAVAEEFRGTAPSTPGDAVPTREDLWAKPQLVDRTARETISA